MPNEERMTLNERRKYLGLIKKRYLKASKFERGRLLDEMQAITGLHRKSLIRLMSGSLERKPRHAVELTTCAQAYYCLSDFVKSIWASCA